MMRIIPLVAEGMIVYVTREEIGESVRESNMREKKFVKDKKRTESTVVFKRRTQKFLGRKEQKEEIVIVEKDLKERLGLEDRGFR